MTHPALHANTKASVSRERRRLLTAGLALGLGCPAASLRAAATAMFRNEIGRLGLDRQ